MPVAIRVGMTNNEARNRGLRLAAKITGIGGIAIAALAVAEARTASAATHDPTGEAAPGESAMKVQSGLVGHCGCAPCWGPPAPPPRGAAS
jgi:hypothetical protein